VDLTGVFVCCKAVVQHQLAAGYGRIVNIASIAGKEGNPTLVPYSTAKAGVIGLTKALAKEVATQGIFVNAVAPAVIGTVLICSSGILSIEAGHSEGHGHALGFGHWKLEWKTLKRHPASSPS